MTSVRSINRSVTPRRAEFSLFCGLTGTGVADFDNGLDSSSWIELPRDRRPDRTVGPDDILEDAVDDILIEYAQVPVAQDVVLQGLELQAGILGDIADGDQPKVGQARLGAEGSELRDLDFDLVAGKLVGKCSQARQPGLKAGLGFFLSVGFPAIVFQARPRKFPSSIYYPQGQDKPARFPTFSVSEGESSRRHTDTLCFYYLFIERGGVPTKALRSGAGTVPLGLPRGEWSEDREQIFLAGKNWRLSEGLPRSSL